MMSQVIGLGRSALVPRSRQVWKAAATAIRGAARKPEVSAIQSQFLSTEERPGYGKNKTSTGLVGLAVDPDAVPKMIVKYQALLDKMAASDMPEDAQYRINVEKIARYRIKAAEENLDDPDKVEELCNCGQVEELVLQAENEMIVLDMYLAKRYWEYVKPVPIEYVPSENDAGDIEWDAPMEKNEETKAKEAKEAEKK